MPRTFGDTSIHISHIDSIVRTDRDIYAKEQEEIGEIEMKIGKIIADEMIDNGSTLQIGYNF